MWSRTLPKKYAVNDLPAGASFVLNEDQKELKLLLKPADEVYDKALKRDVIVPGSAVRVVFINGTFTTHNEGVLMLMLAHKGFDKNGKDGFKIDVTDPTGYWRMSKALTTGTQETVTKVAGKIALQNLDIEGAKKKFKEMADKKEEIKPLAIAIP